MTDSRPVGSTWRVRPAITLRPSEESDTDFFTGLATRVLARVDPDHTASARVLARRGFRRLSTEDGVDHYGSPQLPETLSRG